MFCKQCGHELPDPPPVSCPYCGISIAESAAGSSSTETSQTPPPTPYYCPWEDGDKIGWLNAFFQTIKETMTKPVEFFQKLSPTGKLGSAIIFIVIIGTLSDWFSLPLQFFQFYTHPIYRKLFSAWAVGPAFIIIIGAIFAPISVLILFFIRGAILHFFLWMVGGAQKSFEATLKVLAYSSTPMLLFIIPILGMIVGGIWYLVNVIIGLKEVHDTSYGKVLLAVLLFPFILCCCCMCVFYFIIFSFIASHPDFLDKFQQQFHNFS